VGKGVMIVDGDWAGECQKEKQMNVHCVGAGAKL
jgi:hypothetical protein